MPSESEALTGTSLVSSSRFSAPRKAVMPPPASSCSGLTSALTSEEEEATALARRAVDPSEVSRGASPRAAAALARCAAIPSAGAAKAAPALARRAAELSLTRSSGWMVRAHCVRVGASICASAISPPRDDVPGVVGPTVRPAAVSRRADGQSKIAGGEGDGNNLLSWLKRVQRVHLSEELCLGSGGQRLILQQAGPAIRRVAHAGWVGGEDSTRGHLMRQANPKRTES